MDLLIEEVGAYCIRPFDTIYIGGGTPTAIPIEQLKRLLDVVPTAQEYTLEAGRPETLTDEMLQVIANANSLASEPLRISINPQSMNDEVLKSIGRGHTVKDVYKAYEKARKYDFCINMDLIMLDDFTDSLEKVIALNPDDITVHALAKKRAAGMESGSDYTKTAYDILKQAGYFPYYLYRQSNSIGDNIGYTKSKPCIYNICMTDESSQVFGAGCGAASRLNGKKHYNFKYPYEYINRFNEIIKNKGELL